MMRSMQRLVFVFGLALLFSTVAAAQGMKYDVMLTGSAQVPAVDTKASGEATFQLSDDGMSLSYKISVVDLENATMGHIHLAMAGANGPVATWLYPSAPPPVTKAGKFTGVLAEGTLTAASLTGPLAGKTIADLMTEIKNGNAYVNIHTEKNPNGELRAQIK